MVDSKDDIVLSSLWSKDLILIRGKEKVDTRLSISGENMVLEEKQTVSAGDPVWRNRIVMGLPSITDVGSFRDGFFSRGIVLSLEGGEMRFRCPGLKIESVLEEMRTALEIASSFKNGRFGADPIMGTEKRAVYAN